MSQLTEPADEGSVLAHLCADAPSAGASERSEAAAPAVGTPVTPAAPLPLLPSAGEQDADHIVRPGPAAPPPSHRRSLRRQTTGSFAKATAPLEEFDAGTSTPSTPTPGAPTKGKGRMPPPAPLTPPSSSTSRSTDVEGGLRSAALAASDHTGKTNIPAIKHDLRLIAATVDRQSHAYTSERSSIQQSLSELHNSVQGIMERLTNPSLMAPTSPVPLHDLELRVERLIQHSESIEDQNTAQVDELQGRIEDIENNGRDVSASVARVSSALGEALGVLTQIKTTVATLSGAPTTPTQLRPVAPQVPSPFGAQTTTWNPPRGHRRPRDPSPPLRPPPPPHVPPAQPARSAALAGRGRGRGNASYNRRMDNRGPKRTRVDYDTSEVPGAPVAPMANVPPVAAPAPIPPAVPLPVEAYVRMGPVSWSTNHALLKDQLYATARVAWEALPDGAFGALRDVRLDATDPTYAIAQFPSLAAALSFIDCWVENKYRAPSLAAVHARVM